MIFISRGPAQSMVGPRARADSRVGPTIPPPLVLDHLGAPPFSLTPSTATHLAAIFCRRFALVPSPLAGPPLPRPLPHPLPRRSSHGAHGEQCVCGAPSHLVPWRWCIRRMGGSLRAAGRRGRRRGGGAPSGTAATPTAWLGGGGRLRWRRIGRQWRRQWRRPWRRPWRPWSARTPTAGDRRGGGVSDAAAATTVITTPTGGSFASVPVDGGR